MWLNDHADDEERQLLLPFVTRLACADTPEVEREREAYIQSQMVKGGLTMRRGIEILEGALAIGRQADLLTVEIACVRLEAAKSEARVTARKMLEPAD
jgi:hypothetical protein